MKRRLYRSSTDAMIGGVCGGLGEYFGVDPMLVRVAFALFALFNGLGIMIYIILWIIVPLKEQLETPQADVVRENIEEMHDKAREIGQDIHDAFAGDTTDTLARRRALWAGGALIILGIGMLLNNFGVLHWLRIRQLWPLVIVAFGVLLLINALRERKG